MIDYDSPTALRAFLEERGMAMQKKFGQNFLVNPGARAKLVDALGFTAGEKVWEIGPGLGAMTEGLLSRGADVTAFEIDRLFATSLRELYGENPLFHLVEGDVLKTWKVQDKASIPPYCIGNLPYNIAATLLASFVDEGAIFSRMVVTIQKEVALRMAAKPGDSDYSSFSVLCSSAYRVSSLMTLKAGSFYPAPHVDSAAVLLEKRPDAEISALPRLFRPVTRALFSSRRKTIRNNLDTYIRSFSALSSKEKSSGEITEAVLADCAISPQVRAETLDVASFAAIARSIEEILG